MLYRIKQEAWGLFCDRHDIDKPRPTPQRVEAVDRDGFLRLSFPDWLWAPDELEEVSEERIETGLVFDRKGKTIHWHLPPGRDGGYIPDTRSLWEVMWDNRHDLGGFAHTHPWRGEAWPSSEPDLTTFQAIEDGLGLRLQWWVVTFTDAKCFIRGDERGVFNHHPDPPVRVEDVDELRRISGGE